jgi:hypothetical protein
MKNVENHILIKEKVPVYIMPAGPLGIAAYYAVKLLGYNVECFIDNEKGTFGYKCEGQTIVTPDRANSQIPVVVASTRYSEIIERQLKALCFSEIIEFENFLTKDLHIQILDYIRNTRKRKAIPSNKTIQEVLKTFTELTELNNSNKIIVPCNIDVIITQRCTLKCRDCAALMQYYQHPKHIDMSVTLRSIDTR